MKGCLIVAPLWSDTLMRRAFFVLQPYLTEVWKISFTHAAAIVNIWEGTSLMLPAVFQFLADKYLGNFKVVVLSVISSTLVSTILFPSRLSVYLSIYLSIFDVTCAGTGVGYNVVTRRTQHRLVQRVREGA